MWLVVLFDVPTLTQRDRHEYRTLRQTLLDSGMLMLQYSVYVKPYSGGHSPEPLIRAIEHVLPGAGTVTILELPDRVYQSAYRFTGARFAESHGEDPEPPQELMLF